MSLGTQPVDQLHTTVGSVTAPAAFLLALQGLLINCPDAGVLYSRPLEEAIVLEAIEFAEQHGGHLLSLSA
jgi:hypothetical protein